MVNLMFTDIISTVRALLADLGAEWPDLPRYDPSKDTPYPWEKDLNEFFRATRKAKDAKRKAGVGEG